MKIPTTLILITLITSPLIACSTAPPSERAFSRDWASEHRRAAEEKRLNERRLFVMGTEVRTPEWLDTGSGRAELNLGETSNASTAISVDRGELGLRRRWGGSQNNLPAPPGYDDRGNAVGGGAAE